MLASRLIIRTFGPLLLLFMWALGPDRAQAQRVSATVDSTRSVIHYTGSATMHDWTGTSRDVSGMLVISPSNPESSRAVVRARVASFESGPDRRDRKMQEVTDAEKYPTVTYRTTDIRATHWGRSVDGKSGRWRVKGDLTFHGQTHPVDATVRVRVTEDSVFAHARFPVSLTRFDVERPKLLWVDPIADTIRIEAEVVGAIQEPATAKARLDTTRSEVTGSRQIASAGLRHLSSPRYPGSSVGVRSTARVPSRDQPEWSLSFFGFTDGSAHMVNAKSVTIETTRRTIQPERIESKTRTLDDGTNVEIVQAFFPRSTFRSIANALTVSATIGGFAFPISWTARQDMRLLLEQVPRPSPQKVSSTEGR